MLLPDFRRSDLYARRSHGTDRAISLRACYAMPGTGVLTELRYGATTCYAMSGTDLAYAATRSPVLRTPSCSLTSATKSDLDPTLDPRP
eukprot:3064410-Rhodomonas_salina.1